MIMRVFYFMVRLGIMRIYMFKSKSNRVVFMFLVFVIIFFVKSVGKLEFVRSGRVVMMMYRFCYSNNVLYIVG